MAGVPDIAIDDGGKSPISFAEFREQCEEVLTEKDRKLLFYFYLKQDCLNLVKLLKNPNAEVSDWGNYTMEQYQDLITSARTMNFNVHRYPSFMSIYEVYNLETELVKKMMAEKVFSRPWAPSTFFSRPFCS